MSLSPKVSARLRNQFEALALLPNPSEDSQRRVIKDAKVGSSFTLRGNTYTVQRIHRYTEGAEWEWWELVCFCINTGELVYLEWEKDDTLEVCLTTEADIPLHRLELTASRIDKVVDNEGSVSHQGKVYHYEDDSKVKFFSDNQGKGSKVWMVEFEASDEKHFLSLERWKQEDGTKDWEAHLSVFVDPREVSLIAV
jgi:hypothetical protein